MAALDNDAIELKKASEMKFLLIRNRIFRSWGGDSVTIVEDMFRPQNSVEDPCVFVLNNVMGSVQHLATGNTQTSVMLNLTLKHSEEIRSGLDEPLFQLMVERWNDELVKAYGFAPATEDELRKRHKGIVRPGKPKKNSPEERPNDWMAGRVLLVQPDRKGKKARIVEEKLCVIVDEYGVPVEDHDYCEFVKVFFEVYPVLYMPEQTEVRVNVLKLVVKGRRPTPPKITADQGYLETMLPQGFNSKPKH